MSLNDCWAVTLALQFSDKDLAKLIQSRSGKQGCAFTILFTPMGLGNTHQCHREVVLCTWIKEKVLQMVEHDRADFCSLPNDFVPHTELFREMLRQSEHNQSANCKPQNTQLTQEHLEITRTFLSLCPVGPLRLDKLSTFQVFASTRLLIGVLSFLGLSAFCYHLLFCRTPACSYPFPRKPTSNYQCRTGTSSISDISSYVSPSNFSSPL